MDDQLLQVDFGGGGQLLCCCQTRCTTCGHFTGTAMVVNFNWDVEPCGFIEQWNMILTERACVEDVYLSLLESMCVVAPLQGRFQFSPLGYSIPIASTVLP